jgi:hypothetical protein
MGLLDRFKKQPTINTKQVLVNNQGVQQEFVSDDEARKVIGVLSLKGDHNYIALHSHFIKAPSLCQSTFIFMLLILINNSVLSLPHCPMFVY